MKYEPHCLAVISGWEFVALTTGLLPTITSMVRPLPALVRHGLAFAAGFYLYRHWR